MSRSRLLVAVLGGAVLAGEASIALAQDAVRGRHVYRKCVVCHVSNPSSTELLAPPLHNVVGRQAATIPGFEYSPIMQTAGNKGLIWTKDSLYYFLDRPETFMPGTYMAFAGLESQERLDVIAYLEALTRAYNKQEAEKTGAGAPAPAPQQQSSKSDAGAAQKN
ncbi:MAG: c-type cytochrome [Hyphomicrobiaceae bacterium]|nr:c-type cytochrome [Hyphomicrobiaceae bacterium]